MYTPTVKQFRTAIFLVLACWAAMLLLPTVGIVSFSEDADNLRRWNYYDAELPYWFILASSEVLTFVAVCGLIGMYRFWSLSRWIAAAVIAIELLLVPLVGFAVYSPFEGTLVSIADAAQIWLVAVAFHSPLAARFEPTHDPGDT